MFFLALLSYPVLEIAVFLLVAGRIGWASTLLFALATSFFGVYLLRTQGARASQAQRVFSAQAVENYLYGNLGALLLVLPGFVSDVFGALLLFAPTRRALLGAVRRCGVDLYRQANGPFSVFRAYRFGDGFAGPFADSNRFAPDGADDDPIDVETVAPTRESSAQASSSPSDDDPIDVEFVVRQ
ncbi:MAG: FxsA family protein [Thermoguttaceae bacterium]|nr:FxsA family protein [Thermoguttaceae bacterium]